jgi:hypothetical protein
MAGVAEAGAAEVFVTADITTSTTWTANNTYNLQDQIYVRNGATLTIQAGTLIASDTNIGGSLAVCRGSQIFVMGTKSNPVIMTSKADVATWTGGNPRTGTWREEHTEWGNLTIMGRALISENATAIPGNVATCDPDNVADMEGLDQGASTDRYGGGDDDDDSGTIKYLSLRYGGKVSGLADELNALSLGGIGRDTDIHHIDIMNNVDDGIEIWGGTVNIKHFNIWNVGDDSFDVDQGWRGKAQFGLIVQGYSTQSAQGSGSGDNAFELDGAEDGDYQPVTTATIYNCTVIGQPASLGSTADHATAWRCNARVQLRNCIFMDIGERLVSFDNTDGTPDFHLGYGVNGTLPWATTWATDYNAVPNHANDCASESTVYQAQSSGKLGEIKDSVLFNNTHASAYTEADVVGVWPGDAINDNVDAGTSAANRPIRGIYRKPSVSFSGMTYRNVKSLDPRPANAALVSEASAPADGFFTPVEFRGAVGPGQDNWYCGWTAAEAFGFLSPCHQAAYIPGLKNL